MEFELIWEQVIARYEAAGYKICPKNCAPDGLPVIMQERPHSWKCACCMYEIFK